MIHITKNEKLLNWLEIISDLLCKNLILVHENQRLNSLILEMSLWFVCRKKEEFNLMQVMRFFLKTAMIIASFSCTVNHIF